MTQTSECKIGQVVYFNNKLLIRIPNKKQGIYYFRDVKTNVIWVVPEDKQIVHEIGTLLYGE